MLRLGLRLALSGGRETMVRLAVTAAAVAVGVALLLAVLAEFHAFQANADRQCWECTGTSSAAAPGALLLPARLPAHGELWNDSADFYQGQTIERLDVAALGPGAPVPPGIAELPGPGQYYASPALAALLRTVPADQLGDRFPGKLAGTIGDAALTGPASWWSMSGTRRRRSRRSPERSWSPLFRLPGRPRCSRPSSGGLSWWARPRCCSLSSSWSAPLPGWRRLAGRSGSPPCAWSARPRRTSGSSRPWRASSRHWRARSSGWESSRWSTGPRHGGAHRDGVLRVHRDPRHLGIRRDARDRPGGIGDHGARVAAPCTGLSAGRQPARVPAAAVTLAADRPGRRRRGVCRRAAADQPAVDRRAGVSRPAHHHGRAGRRRAVADRGVRAAAHPPLRRRVAAAGRPPAVR